VQEEGKETLRVLVTAMYEAKQPKILKSTAKWLKTTKERWKLTGKGQNLHKKRTAKNNQTIHNITQSKCKLMKMGYISNT